MRSTVWTAPCSLQASWPPTPSCCFSAPAIGIGDNPKIIAQLTLKHRLPAITLFPDFARAGGLLAYGVDIPQSYRQAAAIIIKVLNGAKPADLPIERSVKFQLVVNQ